MKGWRLVWLPPIVLGLAALAIPASMHTGHRNYDAWQALRGTLWGTAFVYVGLALTGRLAWALGFWVHRQGPTKMGLTRCATCSDLRAMPDRCPKCGDGSSGDDADGGEGVRRSPRILLNCATMFSVVFCLMAGILGAWSYDSQQERSFTMPSTRAYGGFRRPTDTSRYESCRTGPIRNALSLPMAAIRV